MTFTGNEVIFVLGVFSCHLPYSTLPISYTTRPALLPSTSSSNSPTSTTQTTPTLTMDDNTASNPLATRTYSSPIPAAPSNGLAAASQHNAPPPQILPRGSAVGSLARSGAPAATRIPPSLQAKLAAVSPLPLRSDCIAC